MSARVLIVDDDRVSRTVLKTTVESEGYTVSESSGGADALQKLEVGDFDLVLLDLNMPDVDGLSVLRSLRQSGRLPALPVVVVTAHVDQAQKLEALELGALDFTPKALDALELRCRLRNLLELGRLRKEAAVLAKRKAETKLITWIEASIQELHLVLYQIPGNSETDLSKHSVGDLSKLNGRDGKVNFKDLWTRLVHPEDQNNTVQQYKDISSKEQSCWHLVCRWNDERWFLHVGHLDQRRQHFVGALLDVSETKRLEAQFLQAQKMEAVGLLAGGIAHDFNNLLSAILAFSGFAQEGLPESDQRRQDIEEVITAAERAAGLTKQLLTFSRRKTPALETVDLNKRLNGLGKLLKSSIGEHISLKISLSPRPAPVRIDPVQFDQIILNLAVNARDAMSGGGNLSICLETPLKDSNAGSPRIKVLVSDTGRGIEPDLRQRIFEPFFTTKKGGRGTGLGLATCAAIVEQAGGKMEVTSELGSGTTFSIELPFREQNGGESKTLCSPIPQGGGLEILVVEDEASLRQVTRRTLEQAGYLVYTASDGEEAIEKIDLLGNRLAAVLTDIIMPKVGGIEVAAHVEKSFPKVSIIFVTGYMDGRIDQQALGGARLLWKPYRGEELLRILAEETRQHSTPPGVPEKLPPANGRPKTDGDARTFRVPTQETGRAPRQERILIVYQDLKLRNLVEATFVAHRFHLVFGDSLSTARWYFKRQEFDAVLVEAKVQDGAGLEFLSEIGDTPAVYLSDRACPEELKAALQRRVRAYLPKPVDGPELLSNVRRALNEGRLARLQSRWLASRFGGQELIADLEETERLFTSALANLTVEFQPIVRAGDHSIYGYEALVRSSEPRLDEALTLLAAAELLDRVVELGLVVRSLVADVLSKRTDNLDSIFVNVHPLELNAELLGDKKDPLLAYAPRIVLEVNERICMARGPKLSREISRIRELGYRLAVDDLGEGYSGLGSMVALLPNIVKLERCLVEGLHLAPLKLDIVKTVIEMAHRTEIVVVAEGVEQQEEHDILIELGCDLLQGFFLARPGAPFPSLLKNAPQKQLH